MDPTTTPIDSTLTSDDTDLALDAVRPRSVIERYRASAVNPEQAEAFAWMVDHLRWERRLDDLRARDTQFGLAAETTRDRE
jgi:hypothetical protein